MSFSDVLKKSARIFTHKLLTIELYLTFRNCWQRVVRMKNCNSLDSTDLLYYDIILAKWCARRQIYDHLDKVDCLSSSLACCCWLKPLNHCFIGTPSEKHEDIINVVVYDSNSPKKSEKISFLCILLKIDKKFLPDVITSPLAFCWSL